MSRFAHVAVWSLELAFGGGGVVSSPIHLCEQRPWWLPFVEIGIGAVFYNKAAGVVILASPIRSAWLLFLSLFAAMEVDGGRGRSGPATAACGWMTVDGWCGPRIPSRMAAGGEAGVAVARRRSSADVRSTTCSILALCRMDLAVINAAWLL